MNLKYIDVIIFIILRFQKTIASMKNNNHQLTRSHQSLRRYHHEQNNYAVSPRNVEPLEESSERLRRTITKVVESVHELRKSYSTKSNKFQGKDFRMSSFNGSKKYNTMSLKTQVNDLQQKVLSARSQLIHKPFTKKKIASYPIISLPQKDKEDQKPPATDSSITVKNCQRKIDQLVCIMPKPKNFKPNYLNPYSPRKNNIYYVSQAVRAINEKNSLALEHIIASINMIKICEQEGILESSEIQKYKLNLPRKQQYKDKKTLILDLDQTLIHYQGSYQTESDFTVKIKIDDQSEPMILGINIRPHVMTFLKKMAQKFQIIIFTASHETYANAILDVLDPENQIFQHRLYRQHCFVLDRDDIHVKDLRIINRDLSEMVLIDNAAYSYAFQLQNGIPILPFYYGADYELVALEKYLQEIEKCQDVRQLNKRTFKLHHYSKFDSAEELIEELYMNNFQ